MREYKFRAKRNDIDRWIYGQYFTTPLTDENSGTTPDKGWFFLTGEPRHCIVQNMVAFVVDPKTLGQFIGLKDKNGKEIYEGDICVQSNDRKKGVYTVVWQDNGFKLEIIVRKTYDGSSWNEKVHVPIFPNSYEIIGNINENPELLEVSQ